MIEKPRVFGIGLSRTGTQSLAVALRLLGYKTAHYPWTLEELHEHEAAVDIPVVMWFPFIDGCYSGSKFVLTTRSDSAWLESCKRHYAAPWRRKKPQDWTANEREVARTDHAVYGTWQFDPILFAETKKRHEALVAEYFADRPDDLLIINLVEHASQDVWVRLLEFLGCDEIPFPWENRSERKSDDRPVNPDVCVGEPKGDAGASTEEPASADSSETGASGTSADGG